MHNDEQDSGNRAATADLQMAALLASVTIGGVFLVYWVIQIQEVRAMLKLAYG